MQGALFGRILEMSLVGCYSIAVVLLVRMLLKKCERKYSYYLWLIVFVNLCLPFRPQGSFSLIPGRVAEFSLEEVSVHEPEMDRETEQAAETEKGIVDSSPNITEPERAQTIKSFTESGTLIPESPVSTVLPEKTPEGEQGAGYGVTFWKVLKIAGTVWLLGIAALLIYSLFSSFRLQRKLARGRELRAHGAEHIVEVEGLATPFLWGLFHPVIYLPTGMDADEKSYIVAHESCHRRRGDQIVKLLIFTVTVLHWFNPLVWLAYGLCCRDMEISCDEAVLARSGQNIRKEYASSLLKYAAKQNGYVLTPLTFGEPSVKSRIKNVLHYKKKNLIFSVLALVCVAVVVVGLVFRPAKKEEPLQNSEQKEQNESSEETAAGEATDKEANKQAHVIRNNGGSIVEIDGTLYYMQGLPIYTDGEYLYVTKSSRAETYRYELDGSGFLKLFDGNIVDIREDGKELYYENLLTSSVPAGIYSFDTEKEEGRLLTKNSYYLGSDAENLYVRRVEAGENYLDEIDKASHDLSLDILKQSLPQGGITSFHPAGNQLLFAVGNVEGSMGLFNGDFYSYSKTDGTLRKAHLTDASSFQVETVHGGIYYQEYENAGEGGSMLCKANYHLEKTEELGDDLQLLDIDETRGAILAAKRSEVDSRIHNLVLLDAKTGEETLLLDMQAEKWEVYDYDKLQYTEWSFLDDVLYVKVSQWGYREGGGWRDERIKEQYYRVNLDGSGAEPWDPNEASTKISNKGALAGRPCEPEGEGWNLTKVKDVREEFSRMSYVPESGTEGETYLIGQTDTYTLYGKGDYESMLLEHEGQYAQIVYPYASNYMIPVELVESDYDGDGSPELAIKIQVKHGTGVYIDTFFMADPKTDGELFVYEFQERDYLAELQPRISFQETKDGAVQPLVNGLEAGVPLETEEDEPPVENVSVGGQIRFLISEYEIQISAGLEFWREGWIGIADYNGSDLTAQVRYHDGGIFDVEGFSSRDADLEEKLTYALQEYYRGSYTNEKGVEFRYGDGPVEGFETIQFQYDPTRLHEGLEKIIVAVIPEGRDSYDYANVTVRWAGIGGEYKRWIVEDIYLEK